MEYVIVAVVFDTRKEKRDFSLRRIDRSAKRALRSV